MRLKTVTFTGVDEFTDLNRMVKLGVKYPFIEFGILLSKQRTGRENKYPSLSFLNNLYAFYSTNWQLLTLSAHLCGDFARTFSKGEFEVLDFFPNLETLVDRIQVNVDRGFTGFDCDKLARQVYSEKYPYLRMKDYIIQIREKQIHGCREPVTLKPDWTLEDNSFFVTARKAFDRYSGFKYRILPLPLYDSSGGKGISPSEWFPPVTGPNWQNYSTGYSGGLGPDNLKEELQNIASVVDSSVEQVCPIWIDMESKIRTGDKFDLDKVQQCCEIVANSGHCYNGDNKKAGQESVYDTFRRIQAQLDELLYNNL